jgi:hypothetical protein
VIARANIFKRRLGAASLAALLMACAGRIWVDTEDASGIKLHWYGSATAIDAARSRAQEHCKSLGKDAVLIDEFEDQDIKTAYFSCRG